MRPTSGRAERFAVDVTGQCVSGSVPTETIVLFGAPVGTEGLPAGEGHPDPTVLLDVRRL